MQIYFVLVRGKSILIIQIVVGTDMQHCIETSWAYFLINNFFLSMFCSLSMPESLHHKIENSCRNYVKFICGLVGQLGSTSSSDMYKNFTPLANWSIFHIENGSRTSFRNSLANMIISPFIFSPLKGRMRSKI